MENEPLSGPDRLLVVLLVLSIVGNILLAVLLEKSNATKAVLELRLNNSDSISPAEMADLISGHPPTLGKVDAPVTFVLFSDFQCPYCRQLSAALRALGPKQQQQIRIVFRQFPLPFHKYAHRDAEVTACIARQSNQAFWALYGYLYTQANPQEDPMYGIMQFLKDRHDINMLEFSSCLRTHQANETIEHDISLGKTYGVHGTPTMFVNGRRLTGSQQNLGSLLRSIAEGQ